MGCHMKQNLEIAIMAHFLRSPTKYWQKSLPTMAKTFFLLVLSWSFIWTENVAAQGATGVGSL